MGIAPEALSTRRFQTQCEMVAQVLMLAFFFSLPLSTTMTDVVLFSLLPIAFLSSQYRTRFFNCLKRPEVLGVIILFLLYLFSLIYTVAPVVEGLQMLKKMRNLVFFPVLLALCNDSKWRKWGLQAFLVGIMISAIIGCLNAYHITQVATRFDSGHVFKDSIHTSGLFALAIFILLHQVFLNKATVSRFVQGVCLSILLFFMVFISVGRTGQVGLLALWMLYFLQHKGLKGCLLGVGTLALLCTLALVGSEPVKARWEKAHQEVHAMLEYKPGQENSRILQTSMGERISFVKNSWPIFLQKPLLGWGVGSFKVLYAKQVAGSAYTVTRNPHNEYLNIMIQMGLVGLFVFLGALGTLLYQSRTLPLFERFISQGALVLFMLGSLANSWLMDFTSGFLIIGLCALCFGAKQQKERA